MKSHFFGNKEQNESRPHSYFGASHINHSSLTGRFHLAVPQTLIKIYCHFWEMVLLDQSVEFKPACLHWWLDSSFILFKKILDIFHSFRSDLWIWTNIKTDICELTQVKNDLLLQKKMLGLAFPFIDQKQNHLLIIIGGKGKHLCFAQNIYFIPVFLLGFAFMPT